MTSNWKATTVGAFCPLNYGKGLPKRERNECGRFEVYGANGPVGTHDRPLVEEPGVIIGRKGTVGAVHYTPHPFWPIDTTFYVTSSENRDLRFTFYLLKSLDLEEMNADSAVPGLNRNDAHALKITVPPLEEQRRISRFLAAFDDLIALNQRMNKIIARIARSLFSSWFIEFAPVHAKRDGRETTGIDKRTAELFPCEFEDSQRGEVPEGWRLCKIGDLLSLSYGKALKAEDRQPGPVPVFGSNGQVGWHDQPLVEGPGTIVGRKGNPGTTVWSQVPFWPIDTAFHVVPKDEHPTRLYLHYALMFAGLSRLASDSAVPGLNRNIAYMDEIVVPSREVAEEFSRRMGSLHERIHRNQSQNRVLERVRDFFIPKLMSGEVRVGEAEEAAEVSA